MIFKKLFDRLLRSPRDIQERMFLLLTLPALGSLLLILITEYFVGITSAEALILGVSFIIFALVTFYTVRRNRLRLGASLIAFLLVFGLLPLGFFYGGGIYGGAPIWFVFGMVYVSMAVPGRARYFYQFSCALVAAGCFFIAYRDPSLVAASRDMRAIYGNSFISLLFAGFLISSLASFEIAVFREESKRSQAQREEIDQLIQAQNQFFSNMSHEIRTPINTIVGLNEMILREDISDEVAEDAVNIQAASKLLLHLINDILDMSKIESGKMELVNAKYDLGSALSEIVAMLWVRAKDKGLAFHINIDPAVPAELYGDEVRLKQILINVLTNAIKYTREGSVTLTVESQAQDDETALMIFSVTDTGIGIKKESIPYLFSAFRRVDEEKNRYIEGTGLGLSIVKQLVDLMGGSITVNSVYTQGSTFVIEIPQRLASSRQLGQIDLEVRHAINHRSQYTRSFEAPEARVLIVDDDAANRLVATKLLRDTKIAIDTAESGREALRKTSETHYHLILMDHMMPEMDGIECLHEIRTQVGGLCRRTKVVVLTANAGSEERDLYAKEGFDGYLVKPVSGADLERELRRTLPAELINEIGSDVTMAERLGASIRKQQKKIPIAITVCSLCGLPRSELTKRGIAAIPYHIQTDGGVFLDNVEAETRGVLEYMAEPHRALRLEPPSLEECEDFFARQLTRAANIIHITLSSKIGDGYQNASNARQAFGNASVFDSAQAAGGASLLSLEADDMAKAGMSVEQILQELDAVKYDVCSTFIVASAEYLSRAGRVSHTFNKFASAFLLHPVMAVKNGRLVVRRAYIGEKAHILKRYIAYALRSRQDSDARRLIVSYSGLDKDDLKMVSEEIEKRAHFDEVLFLKLSPASSVICGPGMLGLSFLPKRKGRQ